MMRLLRGEFFRIGGIAYQTFENYNVGSITDFGVGATEEPAAQMSFGMTALLVRAYVPPPHELVLRDDAFNRPLLGDNWTIPLPASETDPVISNNQVKATLEDGSDSFAFWSAGADFWDQQFGRIVLQTPLPTGGVGYVGVVLHCDNALDKFYMGAVFGANDCRVYFRNGVSFTQVAFNQVALWQVGDFLRCEVRDIGTNRIEFRLLRNDTLIITHNFDNAEVRDGGSSGFALSSPTGQHLRVDKWAGGELGDPVQLLTRTDNFNRADGALGNNWSYPPASPAPNRPAILSNRAWGLTNSVNCAAYWSAATFDADQCSEAEVHWTVFGSPTKLGVILRAGSVDKFYMGILFGDGAGAADYGIYYYEAGVYTQMIASSSATWADGQRIRCTVRDDGAIPVVNLYQGDNMKLEYRFTNVAQQIATGRPGIIINSLPGDILRLDNWKGGNL